MYYDHPETYPVKGSASNIAGGAIAASQYHAHKALEEAAQRNQPAPRPHTEMEEQLSLLMSMADENEKVICVLRERLDPVLSQRTVGESGANQSAPEPVLSPIASQIRNIRQQLERSTANASSLVGSLAI